MTRWDPIYILTTIALFVTREYSHIAQIITYYNLEKRSSTDTVALSETSSVIMDFKIMGKYSDMIRRAKEGEKNCKATTARGECPNVPMPDSQYCPVHGGNRAYTAARKQRKRLYEVERYKKKISDMTEHESANSFREEIAVLRMMLETQLKQCQDDHDLMLRSQVISSLVMNIEKAVTSATKLELQLGKVLTEQQASAWVVEIIEIIGNHVTDPETLEGISNELLESLQRVTEESRDGSESSV